MTSGSMVDTLSLEAATTRRWDAVVIGAGPAGTLAARQIAWAGARVLLVDKKAFPRTKVCGACLNGQALAVLRSIGLESLIDRLGAVEPEQLQVTFRHRSARFPLPEGRVLSRARLDAALVEAAIAAGADFIQETSAVVERAEGDVRRVRLTRPDRSALAEARLVIVAAGIGNTCLDHHAEPLRTRVAVASRVGLGTVVDECPPAYREPRISMAVARDGYVGIVRDEDGRLNVAAAVAKEMLRRAGSPGEAAAAILYEAGAMPVPALESSQWQGTPPLTRQTRPIAASRLFLLGDATGYVEPFTGEGMAWAMASGRAIAPLALRAIGEWEPGLIGEWSRLHGRLVGRRQAICRGFAAVLRRPWLSRLVFETATRAPVMTRGLIQRVNSPPVSL
ncbi:NAD(P)/FAD-dependent oxidoreductase [Singulisphaera sp. PoT]|uniref:NAD(P)/FAD-dependent oxidoreductase n=1 Tax=Singulisphaera sp. PoT TaxID=3411797 RepID=UPI003BF49EAF